MDNLASSTGDKVICAADFMGCRRLLLESWRDYLYDKMPVPEGWHKAYANGGLKGRTELINLFAS